jgi:ATP-dependent DNA ligase
MSEMPYSAQLCGGQVRPEELDAYEATGNFVAEQKFDGIYCIAEVGIESPRFWSRHSKTKNYDLPRFPMPAVLVGELAFGSQASTDAVARAGHGFLHVFDMLQLNGESLDGLVTRERRVRIENLWDGLDGVVRDHYRIAEQRLYDFRAWYDEIVGRGDEGLVLKSNPGMAWAGERIDDWLKCKKEITVDAVLMGVEVSTSAAWKGIAKSLIIGQYDASGTMVEIGRASGLSAKDRRFFWEMRDELVAAQTVIEVKCNEVFRSGSLRHPNYVRVRDDKPASECRLGGSR